MSDRSRSGELIIDVVSTGDAGGAIGMTVQPGRTDWGRDLEADLDRIAQWRPDLIVTLVEPHEFVAGSSANGIASVRKPLPRCATAAVCCCIAAADLAARG